MKNSDNLRGILFGMICDTTPATCYISPNCEDSYYLIFCQIKNDKKKMYLLLCVTNKISRSRHRTTNFPDSESRIFTKKNLF